jgi:nucleoid DNA-binding protein
MAKNHNNLIRAIAKRFHLSHKKAAAVVETRDYELIRQAIKYRHYLNQTKL